MSAFAPEMAISPPAFLLTGTILTVITAIIVAIRTAANARYTKTLLSSDYMALVAVVLLAGSFACLYKVIEAFRDPGTSIMTLQKYSLATSFVTGASMWSAKAPILLLFTRLFGVEMWLRSTCYFVLVSTAVAYFLGAVIPGALCPPRDVALTDPMGLLELMQCARRSSQAGVSLGTISLATDLIILALPLPFISKMRLPRNKKIGLMAVFLTGIFAIAASAVSLFYKVKSYRGTSSEMTIAMLSTLIECAIAIIVSCAPGVYCFGTNFAKSALYSKIASSLSRHSVSSRSKASSKPSSKNSSIRKETEYIVAEEDSSSTKSQPSKDIYAHYHLTDLETGLR